MAAVTCHFLGPQLHQMQCQVSSSSSVLHSQSESLCYERRQTPIGNTTYLSGSDFGGIVHSELSTIPNKIEPTPIQGQGGASRPALLHGTNTRFLKYNKNELVCMSPGDLRAALTQLQTERAKLEEDLRIVKVENSSLRRVLRYRARAEMLSRTWDALAASRADMTEPCNDSPVPLHASTLVDPESPEFSKRTAVDEEIEPHNNNSISVILSQSLTVLSQINNQETYEKVCATTVALGQVTGGSIAGYVASHLFKRFGKVAVGSAVGSICLLKYAHQNGYISVDWSRIQTHLDTNNDCNEEDNNDVSWFCRKVQDAKQWSKNNSCTVVGFWTGFLFHTLA